MKSVNSMANQDPFIQHLYNDVVLPRVQNTEEIIRNLYGAKLSSDLSDPNFFCSVSIVPELINVSDIDKSLIFSDIVDVPKIQASNSLSSSSFTIANPNPSDTSSSNTNLSEKPRESTQEKDISIESFN